GNSGRVLVPDQLVPEWAHVEAQLLGMASEVQRSEVVLVGEKGVVHLPEFALGSRGLRCLRSQLCPWVHIIEGKMAPDVAQVVTERGQQLADDWLCPSTVRALQVPVLDERHGCVFRAPNMVPIRVNVI